MVGAVAAEIVLCYNLRLYWMNSGERTRMVCDAILLILCSVFILVILFALLVQRNLEDELKIISQLRRTRSTRNATICAIKSAPSARAPG